MNHKYIKYKKKENKRDARKRTECIHNAIKSTEILTADYREIFDNAVGYAYGEPLDEYSEKSIYAIMVNDIRHNYSNYDQILKSSYGVYRSEYDYIQYKNAVLNKIASVYPSLEAECNRQKRKLDMVKICN